MKNARMDYFEFMDELIKKSENKAYTFKVLGTIEENPIIILSKNKVGDCLNILVAAGFHGDEPAGCFGILHFLKHVSRSTLSKINLSFLPLVNPTGFKINRHENYYGENPNRGFCQQNNSEILSAEGKILLNNIQMLKLLAKDGFVSLHEDTDKEDFYLYTFENSNAPGLFSESLRNDLAKFFKQHKNGSLYAKDEVINNGIIFRYDDGSFEDFLAKEGVPYTACTEAPGLCDLEMRTKANASIIDAFINFSIYRGQTSHLKII